MKPGSTEGHALQSDPISLKNPRRSVFPTTVRPKARPMQIRGYNRGELTTMKSLAEFGPRRVESRQNARIKELRAGLSRGARTEQNHIAIEGLHLLQEALKSGLKVHTVLVRAGSEGLLEQLPLEQLPFHDTPEVLIVAEPVFLSAAVTEHPQGIAALVDPPEFKVDALFEGLPASSERTAALVVVAGGLQDPGNLGTLVRSAEAFGATGMILLPGTVSLWNAKTLRASSGSAFRLPVVSLAAEDAFDALKRRGVRLFAAVAREGAGPADLRGPSALLLGNEGAGLPEAWIAKAHARVTIPCPGAVESLNAAVAGSVLLYEAMRQRLAVPAQEQAVPA
jgi:TrmH family RNA methyltransferase